jgi:hypothetical protein
MPKFKYVGNPSTDPAEATAFGYKFALNGDFVEVTDPVAVAKLSGNHTFVEEGKEKAPAKVDAKAKGKEKA